MNGVRVSQLDTVTSALWEIENICEFWEQFIQDQYFVWEAFANRIQAYFRLSPKLLAQNSTEEKSSLRTHSAKSKVNIEAIHQHKVWDKHALQTDKASEHKAGFSWTNPSTTRLQLTRRPWKSQLAREKPFREIITSTFKEGARAEERRRNEGQGLPRSALPTSLHEMAHPFNLRALHSKMRNPDCYGVLAFAALWCIAIQEIRRRLDHAWVRAGYHTSTAFWVLIEMCWVLKMSSIPVWHWDS